MLQSTIKNKENPMSRILIPALLSLILSFTSLSAYDLKSNMLLLDAELREVQRNFMISNREGVEESVNRFAKHAKELFGSKEKFKAMLPKNKQSKANEAVMAAQIIEHNVQIILDAINNKHKQHGRIRREESQRAYSYIEHACFRCHNLVRDDY